MSTTPHIETVPYQGTDIVVFEGDEYVWDEEFQQYIFLGNRRTKVLYFFNGALKSA